jgi:fumarate hydratase class II
MYPTIQMLHSLLAYAVLILMIVAVLNAVIGYNKQSDFSPRDFKLTLWALIATHTQVLIGLVLYFISPLGIKSFSSNGAQVMKDATLRLFAVEHISVMIIAAVLLTIGYAKQKRTEDSATKFKRISIFYGIALLLILSRIPWAQWLD